MMNFLNKIVVKLQKYSLYFIIAVTIPTFFLVIALPLIMPQISMLHYYVFLYSSSSAIIGIDLWGSTAIIACVYISGLLCLGWRISGILKRTVLLTFLAILLTLLLMPFFDIRAGVSVNLAVIAVILITFFNIDESMSFRNVASKLIFTSLFPILIADFVMIPIIILKGQSGVIGGHGINDALNVTTAIVLAYVLILSRSRIIRKKVDKTLGE
jgi:hypothetical protein